MKTAVLTIFMFFTYCMMAQQLQNATVSDSNEIPGFKLYPNPVYDDTIYILTDLNDVKDISVFDVFGKIVLRNRIKSNSLDIKNLDPGVYVLQVTELSTTTSRKLVIK